MISVLHQELTSAYPTPLESNPALGQTLPNTRLLCPIRSLDYDDQTRACWYVMQDGVPSAKVHDFEVS